MTKKKKKKNRWKACTVRFKGDPKLPYLLQQAPHTFTNLETHQCSSLQISMTSSIKECILQNHIAMVNDSDSGLSLLHRRLESGAKSSNPPIDTDRLPEKSSNPLIDTYFAVT